MPNTASASLFPWTWAMPQSSRVMVTREASSRQRASSGGEAAVRRKRSGRKTEEALRIRKRLLRLAPACKHLRRRPLQKLVDIAHREMVATLVLVELFPGDRRGHRRPFATAHGKRHHGSRAALVAQPVQEYPLLALDLADVCGEHFRFGLGNRSGEAFRETLDGRPVLRLVEGRDHVETFTARQQRKGLQAEVAEQCPQPDCRFLHHRE